MTDHTRTYRTRFHAGPLFGQFLRVEANDPIDAAGIVGRALGRHAMDTGMFIPHDTGTIDLFGAAPVVETITIQEALEALQHAER